MARFLLLIEYGLGGFSLEDGSGDILLETSSAPVGCSGSVTVLGQPLPNATVSWIGTASGNATTDNFGEWNTTSVLWDGVYAFTPILTGYVFIPPSQIVAVSEADVIELNFFASPFFTAGQFPPSELHATYAGVPGTVLTEMNNPDNETGTNTNPSLNENLSLKVTSGQPFSVHPEIRGRFDQFNVINNPA